MKTKDIRQTITFKATPHEVYETLMDSRLHAKVTGGRASVSRKIGGKISAYDGYISGTNVGLAPDRKIVQSWRASDWPEGHFSEVIFKLAPSKGGTRLTFVHKAIPEEEVEGIRKGWHEFYWTPMKAFFEKRRGMEK